MALELDRTSNCAGTPEVSEQVRELLMDCGEPVPAMVAVFEPHDAIEGSFDEEARGMLELTPEPNLIIPLNGESAQSVSCAFGVLEVVSQTLALAAELIALMPGNAKGPKEDFEP